MRLQILNLDDSIPSQLGFLSQWQPAVLPMQEWGRRIRIACRFGVFTQFTRALNDTLDAQADTCIRLYGSGDFHHVSLPVLSRLTTPFNLLVFDHHPDWMRGIPFMHCGTWLNHAARLPLVRQVFHVGGDVDFDNGYRRLAPWGLIQTGKIVVIPAQRTFTRGKWSRIPHSPFSAVPNGPLCEENLEALLQRFLAGFDSTPLYISIDKDVLREGDAITNWDSGMLSLDNLLVLLQGFIRAAHGNLAGVDLLGDWSPFRADSWLGRLFHRTQHPADARDFGMATIRNEVANNAIVETVVRACAAASNGG